MALRSLEALPRSKSMFKPRYENNEVHSTSSNSRNHRWQYSLHERGFYRRTSWKWFIKQPSPFMKPIIKQKLNKRLKVVLSMSLDARRDIHKGQA